MTFTEMTCGAGLAPSDTKAASRASSALRKEAALDWFAFFCADLQAGFGPFISVYLTAEKWTQTDIGVVLMIAGLVGLTFQMPGGLIVDKARSKLWIAGFAVAAIGAAALLTATSSAYAFILLAWAVHSIATCLLNPAIASMSLDLVGHERIGARLGRNATFASLGNALAAAAMGGFASYYSNRALFVVTAALAVPALTALLWLRPARQERRVGARARQQPDEPAKARPSINWRSLLTNRQLLALALAVGFFTLANASMLPLLGSVLTLRAAHAPAALIAACIVVPQIMVAIASPLVGRLAQSWGRRPLLLIGLAALPIRCFWFGFIDDPYLFVPIQILDGVSAAVIGVLVPLVAADATRAGGGYALAQGLIGTAIGVGGAFSATIAGALSDRFGSTVAFEGLAVIAMLGLVAAAVLMPETQSVAPPAITARERRSRRAISSLPKLIRWRQPTTRTGVNTGPS